MVSGRALGLLLLVTTALRAEDRTVRVADDAALRAAVAAAKPGTRILIAPGKYRPGLYATLVGTEKEPIVIEGADGKNPPLFEGGTEALHLSDCAYLTLRNIACKGQTGNGVNIDDAGTFDTPAHHVVLERLRVSEIGPRGNFDAIKLSGLDHFVVRDCEIEGWGGQAIDMVGCHHGLIEGCTFRRKAGFSQTTGPQAKGGSSDVVIRDCTFVDAADRGVQMGGSTDLKVFRPQGARYEARNVTVEGCRFVGCQAPVTFVGVDGAVVRYNTFYRPGKWIARILQETTAEGFVPCRNGRFEHNLIVYRGEALRPAVNLGPHTAPETFVFSDNLWFREDQPSTGRLELPAPERAGVYGIDPKLKDPDRLDFTPLAKEAAAFGATAWPRKPADR